MAMGFLAARLRRRQVEGLAHPDLAAILDLPIEERLEIVGVICDSIVDDTQSPEMRAEQRAELDRRLADFDSNPDAGEAWEAVRERISNSLRR